MWKPIKALTNMEALPGEPLKRSARIPADKPMDITAQESSHTRRDKRVSLQLPGDVLEKLQQSKWARRSAFRSV